MDYWVSVSICTVTVLAQPGIINKQTTIINCWENVWPGCVENFEGFEGAAERMKNSVKNIMHAAQQISEGFGDMKENVEEILAEKAIDSDDSQPKSPELSLL